VQVDARRARCHRIRIPLIAVPSLLLSVAVPCAGAGVDDCRQITDDAERLACYDELFGREESSDPPGDANTAGAGKEVTDGRPDPDAASEFGAEQLPAQAVDSIEARLVGDFTGWSGDTVFRLDNGQVWQQTRNYIRAYTPREPMHVPRVTISKGLFGSYDLRIEGVKRVVQVKRIK